MSSFWNKYWINLLVPIIFLKEMITSWINFFDTKFNVFWGIYKAMHTKNKRKTVSNYSLSTGLLVFFFCTVSTNFTMLLLRNCRRSIASSLGWCRAQAHTVESSRVRWHTGLVVFTPQLPCADWNLLFSVSFSAFTDNTQKDLLKLIGNIPVCYEGEPVLGTTEGRNGSQFSVLMTASLFQGRSYNFPVLLWLMDSFPFTPPICLLRPTSNMVIREGKHVDSRGRIFLPGLHGWDYVGFMETAVSRINKFVQSAWPFFLLSLLCYSQSRPWLLYWRRWLPSLRRILRFLQKLRWATKTRMNFWLSFPIWRLTMVLHQTQTTDTDVLAGGFHHSFTSAAVLSRFSQTRPNDKQSVGHRGRRLGDGVSHEHFIKGDSPLFHWRLGFFH